MTHLRFHAEHHHLSSPFGSDAFGRIAEGFARIFGTPYFILVQTALVVAWIAANAAGSATYDPYPFILLNLAFSTQAAYAAPLILLAATRQADRDKAVSDADARHREDLARIQVQLLQQNTDLTEQIVVLSRSIERLTREVHGQVTRGAA